MTKEALKLALEALEEAADAIDSWGSYASGYFQVKHDLENDISKARNAITAIKEALSQPEQEPVAWMYEVNNAHTCLDLFEPPDDAYDEGTLHPLYTTPPQQEAKPFIELDPEEMLEEANTSPSPKSFAMGAAWANAKLKEKNT